jgi:hypothetical protein
MRKVKFAMMGLALAAAGSAQAAGIGARIGTTGLGADVAWDLAPTLSARIGYSGGSVNHDVSTDLTTYHGKLNLKNLNTFLDFAPLGPFFRFTGGFVFNDNKFDVHTDQVSGGSISGTVKPSNSAAPYLGIGYGRVAGPGVNFYADLGVMYQGSPKASLTANCGTLSAAQCAPLQSQVATQQAQLEDKLKNAKYYPVLNIGLTIGF